MVKSKYLAHFCYTTTLSQFVGSNRLKDSQSWLFSIVQRNIEAVNFLAPTNKQSVAAAATSAPDGTGSNADSRSCYDDLTYLAKGILLLHQSYFGSKLVFASFLINCLEHKNVHFPNVKFFRNFYIIFPFCVSLSPFLHIKVWLFKGLIL